MIVNERFEGGKKVVSIGEGGLHKDNHSLGMCVYDARRLVLWLLEILCSSGYRFIMPGGGGGGS